MKELQACVFDDTGEWGSGFVTEIEQEGYSYCSDVDRMMGARMIKIRATLNGFTQPKTIKEMDEVFYMNWMQGSSSPTHQFTAKADALAEAARLSATHRQAVYTLQAVVKTKPRHDVETTELKEKALPETTGTGSTGA